MNDGLYKLEKIHTDHNGSDMFTKNLQREKLEFFRSFAGMASSFTQCKWGDLMSFFHLSESPIN